MSRTLVATAEPLLAASAISGDGETSGIDVLTGQASLDALLAAGTKYSAAVVTGKASLAPAFLGGVAKALQPGGRVTLQLGAGGATQDEARIALLLSGFVDAAPAPGGALTAAAPAWGVGAKSALKKPAAKPAAPAPVAAAWKLALDDDGGDGDLVDEEELLTEEDKLRPAPAAAAAAGDDCEVGAARKACKNCSCGRAEAEAAGVKVQLTDEMLQNPGVGSCGNCSLGDAFRCAGCPYRGLPSFQPGKPLTLPSDFLVADA
ncbi:anamorsin [Raphidocelis subcapitata]|uniref:Anamorsin homolog n=1 Tax=Raphidocelis subcapitata TaxID=307507 RepID=A0A2V0PD30_9CHLO|nr:anamorsin [Raphidocelis subcapitata]|eukprot:GBF96862.1 anamorsin [Raphidocelis subcapitata]